MTRAMDRREAAAILRRLLAAVERGDLDADTPQGRALFTYLAGAADALDESAMAVSESSPAQGGAVRT